MDAIVDMPILRVKLRLGSVERLGPLLLSLALTIAFVSAHLRSHSSKFTEGPRMLITRSEFPSTKLLYNNLLAFYKTSGLAPPFSPFSPASQEDLSDTFPLLSEVWMAVLLEKIFLSLLITLLIE